MEDKNITAQIAEMVSEKVFYFEWQFYLSASEFVPGKA